jgi:hypothetical protein
MALENFPKRDNIAEATAEGRYWWSWRQMKKLVYNSLCGVLLRNGLHAPNNMKARKTSKAQLLN